VRADWKGSMGVQRGDCRGGRVGVGGVLCVPAGGRCSVFCRGKVGAQVGSGPGGRSSSSLQMVLTHFMCLAKSCHA